MWPNVELLSFSLATQTRSRAGWSVWTVERYVHSILVEGTCSAQSNNWSLASFQTMPLNDLAKTSYDLSNSKNSGQLKLQFIDNYP